jgi:hypothetical protein
LRKKPKDLLGEVNPCAEGVGEANDVQKIGEISRQMVKGQRTALRLSRWTGQSTPALGGV